jgi:lysophospholipase L1-like esterase
MEKFLLSVVMVLVILYGNGASAKVEKLYLPLLSNYYCPNQHLSLNFLSFGDSITGCFYDSYYGWADPPIFPDCGYERRVYDRLNQEYGFCPGKLAFFNYATGGETTSGGLDRFYDTIMHPEQDQHRLYPQTAAVTLPNLVIIMEGSNDLNQGVSDFLIEINLRSMVDLAQKAGKQVIIATLPPSFDPDPLERQQRIPAFNSRIPVIASDYNIPVADVYSRLYGHPEWMSEDGLHLSGAGFDQMADVFYQAIVDLLFP